MRRPVVAATLAGALLLGATGIAGATADAQINRIQGVDRYGTSVAIATTTFETGRPVALLANGNSPADAIAASYISGASVAPLLLTEGNRVTPSVMQALENLEIAGVILVGGTAALSAGVVTELEAAGFTVDRVQGVNRYETARKLAELLPGEAIGEFGGGRAAFLTRGDTFADSLAAGPLSAGQGMPVLLTETGALNEHARAVLENDDLGITNVVLLGGTHAISDAVVTELNDMGLTTERIAGVSRQATAVELANVAFDELQFPATRVLLARGDSADFADALAGASRGGQVGAPLLLTTGVETVGDATRAFLAERSATIATVDILGGTSAISDGAAAAALASARGQS